MIVVVPLVVIGEDKALADMGGSVWAFLWNNILASQPTCPSFRSHSSYLGGDWLHKYNGAILPNLRASPCSCIVYSCMMCHVWFSSLHALSASSLSSAPHHPARLHLLNVSFPRNAGWHDTRVVQGPIHVSDNQTSCIGMQPNKISSRAGPTTKTTKHDWVYNLNMHLTSLHRFSTLAPHHFGSLPTNHALSYIQS
jgi:hypothetical protein